MSLPLDHVGSRTVRPLAMLEGHGEGAVFDVRSSHNGLISAGEDGAVAVWDIELEDDDPTVCL